jgi:triacylglycerol lipase
LNHRALATVLFFSGANREERMNLVFASGFLVPQNLLGINYFRGVEANFASRHITICPPVPPFGTSDERAIALANGIHTKFPQGEIHIIAHSLGGLDSRQVIARNLNGLSVPGRIVSLTTLSTPHHGSPVADLVLGPEPAIGPQRLVYALVRQALGLLGIPNGALENLTTLSASRVPDVAQTHTHIRYRSYFAAGRPGVRQTCIALAPTHHYLDSLPAHEDNDGVVTLSSAQYGKFQQPSWECDHAEMVGHDLDTEAADPRFKHLVEFEKIVAKLQL